MKINKKALKEVKFTQEDHPGLIRKQDTDVTTEPKLIILVFVLSRVKATFFKQKKAFLGLNYKFELYNINIKRFFQKIRKML